MVIFKNPGKRGAEGVWNWDIISEKVNQMLVVSVSHMGHQNRDTFLIFSIELAVPKLNISLFFLQELDVKKGY